MEVPSAEDLAFLYAMQGQPDYWQADFAGGRFMVELWSPAFWAVPLWVCRVLDQWGAPIRVERRGGVESTKGQDGNVFATVEAAFQDAASLLWFLSGTKVDRPA